MQNENPKRDMWVYDLLRHFPRGAEYVKTKIIINCLPESRIESADAHVGPHLEERHKPKYREKRKNKLKPTHKHSKIFSRRVTPSSGPWDIAAKTGTIHLYTEGRKKNTTSSTNKIEVRTRCALDREGSSPWRQRAQSMDASWKLHKPSAADAKVYEENKGKYKNEGVIMSKI